MLEQPLFALVRAALLAELPDGVEVLQKNNPVTVGTSSAPTIYMEAIVPGRRVGWVSRQDRLKLDLTEFDHEELQWLATTLQISALARLVDGQPSAADLAQMAADILQGDAGMAMMAAQRVRPLRVDTSRTVYFLNDSQQYEANPSFDIVLMHVQIRESITPRLETIEHSYSGGVVLPTPVLDLQAASDTGSSATDDITADTTPDFDAIFAGGLQVGDIVRVLDEGVLVSEHEVTAPEVETGVIALGLAALAEGVHTISVRLERFTGGLWHYGEYGQITITITASPP